MQLSDAVDQVKHKFYISHMMVCFMQCRKKLVEIFRMELEKRKKNPNLDKTTHDLMDVFIQMEDEEGSQLSDEEVLDNIVNLTLGGFTPIAVAAMWAVYYLAKLPNVLNKLRVCMLKIICFRNMLLTISLAVSAF